jgi:exfoliative toxin A/B
MNNNLFKKVPIPICGLILGVIGLGMILQDYSINLKYVCTIIGCFLILLLLIKTCKYPVEVKNEINNPIILAITGTLSMALMILATYINPYNQSIAFTLWIIALTYHIFLVIVYTLKFALKIDLKTVFTNYFIVYVGIGMAAITGSIFKQQAIIGNITFIFSLISFIILFFIVGYRYMKLPVEEPFKPLICIYAAPVSLCLCAYLQTTLPKFFTFIIIMFILATIFYIFALIKLVQLRNLPFYPSYAAFTFPFVIKANGTRNLILYLTTLGLQIPELTIIFYFETIVSVILVSYVLIKYLSFIFTEKTL